MDKIAKALKKLSSKEKKRVKSILLDLENGSFLGLDIKRLKGHKDIYRVRKGGIRIIYKKNASSLKILALERRSEKTYKI